MSSLSRSSRPIPRLLRVQTRSYADPRLDQTAPPSDTRLDVIRRALYPADAYKPNSPSPSGAYHPDHLARIKAVIHSPEVYETIDRAWQLHQRLEREARKRSLEARYAAMVDACDELDRITSVSKRPASGAGVTGRGSEGDGAPEEGVGSRHRYPRAIYDAAMLRPNPYKLEMAEGRTGTALSRWREGRLAGYFPREAWIPTETRGKGWKYDWKRPLK